MHTLAHRAILAMSKNQLNYARKFYPHAVNKFRNNRKKAARKIQNHIKPSYKVSYTLPWPGVMLIPVHHSETVPKYRLKRYMAYLVSLGASPTAKAIKKTIARSHHMKTRSLGNRI